MSETHPGHPDIAGKPTSSGSTPEDGTPPSPGAGARGRGGAWQRLQRRIPTLNGRMILGLIVFGGMIVVAVFAPVIATHDPYGVDMVDRLQGPGADNWLGTDNNGRDVFSRIVYGARVSMGVGGSVVLTTTILGTVIGLVSGYYRAADRILMRVMDAFMSFPSILLAIAVMAGLGPSARNVVIALTVTYTPLTARVVRGKALSVREETYVESARAVGLGDTRILYGYILPNCLAPLIVQATFILALAIIAEAGLSFIGAGTPPPTPSWGNILAEGRAYMRQAEWMTLFPGLFIMVSVMSLNVLGDGLRDSLDPRMKDKE